VRPGTSNADAADATAAAAAAAAEFDNIICRPQASTLLTMFASSFSPHSAQPYAHCQLPAAADGILFIS